MSTCTVTNCFKETYWIWLRQVSPFHVMLIILHVFGRPSGRWSLRSLKTSQMPLELLVLMAASPRWSKIGIAVARQFLLERVNINWLLKQNWSALAPFCCFYLVQHISMHSKSAVYLTENSLPLWWSCVWSDVGPGKPLAYFSAWWGIRATWGGTVSIGAKDYICSCEVLIISYIVCSLVL